MNEKEVKDMELSTDRIEISFNGIFLEGELSTKVILKLKEPIGIFSEEYNDKSKALNRLIRGLFSENE